MTYDPPDDDRVYCEHIDGDLTNNHLDNLRWVKKNEFRRGVRSVSVLNPKLVQAIRKRFAAGENIKDLAEVYDVNPATIRCVVIFKSWKNIHCDDRTYKAIMHRLEQKAGIGRRKLTLDEVQEIRDYRENGLTLKAIGEMYDLDMSTISLICNHKRWKE